MESQSKPRTLAHTVGHASFASRWQPMHCALATACGANHPCPESSSVKRSALRLAYFSLEAINKNVVDGGRNNEELTGAFYQATGSIVLTGTDPTARAQIKDLVRRRRESG